MLYFINQNVPEELKAAFAINISVHSYESCSSMVFTSHFGLNRLHHVGANIWNKFYRAFLYKEPNLTKTKLKKLL